MTQAATDWERVKELFASTFEAPPDERLRALQAESNERVRRKVESMLHAHQSARGPLDESVLKSVDSLDVSLITPTPNLVGRRLGPYRLVREVGRGGMGAVYEAVREDSQFEQRVAIKTLGTGAGSAAILKRFDQERRILAGLQHPNIAALYDGAITDDGLPYFVLEFVDGLPVDVYCDSNRTSLRDRITLFLQVLSAVQYAHQQLVVHRDIKPGNILVTRDGAVKLVDFGIAKLLSDGDSQVTADLIAPLTLSYASPEQVTAAPITTVSDIYSLGVVLYRLLVGSTPLRLDDLSLERAVNTLCDVTPPAPSEAATAEAADTMQLGPVEKLQRCLRGDLDAILLTALRKEPERRYATVRELGDDLERFLKGLPVAAAGDDISYRLGKFVRRHRGLVAASGIAMLAVVAGGTSTFWQARSARHEAERAASVSAFLQNMIGAGDLSESAHSPRLGPAATVSQLLDSAASRLPQQFRDDPRSRADIHLALGRAFLTQQRWRAAQHQFEMVRRLDPAPRGKPNVVTARALQGLATIQAMSGDPVPIQMALQSLDILDQHGLQKSVDYARSLRLLGILHAFEGSYYRADTMLALSLALYNELTPGPSVEKAVALADHAAIGEATGRGWDETTAAYARALAMLDSVPGDIAEKADILWYAARAEAIRGDRSKADSLGMQALRVLERAAGPRSSAVAQQLAQLAYVARTRGDSATARRHIERAMTIVDSDPEVPGLIRERAQMEYARHKLMKRELAAAESLASVTYRARTAKGNWVYLLDAQLLYSDVLMTRRKFHAAEPVMREAYDLSVKSGATVYRGTLAGKLARLYLETGRPQMAEQYMAVLHDSTRNRLRTTHGGRSDRSIQ